MRQGKKSFRHESLQDTTSVQKILKAITKGIDSGEMTFSDEDDEMVMKPEGLLHLKLRASQDESRHRISIRLSWQVEDDKIKKKKSLYVT